MQNDLVTAQADLELLDTQLREICEKEQAEMEESLTGTVPPQFGNCVFHSVH